MEKITLNIIRRYSKEELDKMHISLDMAKELGFYFSDHFVITHDEQIEFGFDTKKELAEFKYTLQWFSKILIRVLKKGA